MSNACVNVRLLIGTLLQMKIQIVVRAQINAQLEGTSINMHELLMSNGFGGYAAQQLLRTPPPE